MAHLIPEIVAGRGPVFASVGAESTAQAIIYARESESAGNGCPLMAIPPTLTGLAGAVRLFQRSSRSNSTTTHHSGRFGLCRSSHHAGGAGKTPGKIWPRQNFIQTRSRPAWAQPVRLA